ncbi:MAG: hypothetical protein FJX18_03695 [Alphaproteobacteria bacterium]|nr:hypothetical protein [Alphaproteobacteria bacterium]
MKQFFSYLVVLGWVSFATPTWAILDIFSAPCGCSRLKAGQDIASIQHESELKGKEHFAQCLQCKEIRAISDIEPYLYAFLRQLPEKEYRDISHFLQTTNFGPKTYSNLLQEEAEKGSSHSDKRVQSFLRRLQGEESQKAVREA